MVHHIPIGPHAIRVWIDVAKKPNAYLWRPTSEMTCIEEALGSTVAWPSDKVIISMLSNSNIFCLHFLKIFYTCLINICFTNLCR